MLASSSKPTISHLPPTLLINAGYDILLSEGLLLKQRMEESGVDVEHHVAEKIFHGFFDFLIPGVIHTPTLIFDKMGELFRNTLNRNNIYTHTHTYILYYLFIKHLYCTSLE